LAIRIFQASERNCHTAMARGFDPRCEKQASGRMAIGVSNASPWDMMADFESMN
jgi:hypothetical protein